jgi:prepilin-type N-terminal cleavage/methylation domain-containing protein
MSHSPELPTSERDAGFTLPEMLISVMISGILIVAISMAFTTVIRTEASASTRLAESKDITFVQTWLPIDLSSSIASYDEAADADLAARLAGGQPSITINHDFGPESTNVLTLVRPDLDAGPGVYYVVTYRYEMVNGEWRISRYEIRNPGQGPAETVKTVGVAYEIPSPPPGWEHKTTPTHATDVVARTQYIRPVGENVTFKFESGKTFVSGGGGLSAENVLPTNGRGGLRNPSAPPSRCGGRIALVIDTSGSVPKDNGGPATEQAAVGFIRGFSGTPTTLSLNGFDLEAYGMSLNPAAPATNGVRSPYLSLLNPGPTVDAIAKRVTDLDDIGPDWPGAPTSRYDPNGDGIMWNQIGAGTNWEDGLWNVFRNSAGAYYGTEQPELVVFITDGEPNRVRTAAGGQMTKPQNEAADAAAVVAKQAVDDGSRLIGVMVGGKSKNTTYVNLLKKVVGANEWKGKRLPDGSIDVANAAEAQLFKGEFDELGTILRSIMIAECGGTLTLQKRIDTGGALENPTNGSWLYSTALGDRTLDRSETSSITFDYRFGPGESSKTVEIIEAPVGGYVFDRAECTADGVAVAATPLADPSVAGVSVTVSADKAVSCLMISRPA